MKKGKYFGACVMAAAMAFSAAFAAAPKTEAFAAEVTKTEEVNVVLDSSSEDTKMYQLPLEKFAGNGDLEKIVVTVTFAQTETLGWVGGGGAIGYSTDSDWQQVDFEHQFVDGSTNTVDIPIEIPDGINVTYDPESIIQVGWWWGSTPSITVDKITLVFDDPNAAPAVEDTAPADDTSAPADKTELPKTGLVSSVVFLAAGALLSGAGVVVAKGKKED